ncbi:MAG: integrase core domain-containing protein [Burkholderiaceae bacterium]
MQPALVLALCSSFSKTIHFSTANETAMQDLLMGLTHYFLFYNQERLHQSLGYATPAVVYRTASVGGAKIVDKFGGAQRTQKNWDSAIPL